MPDLAEALRWGAVPVDTFALSAVDLSGLLAIPEARGEHVTVAGRDGALWAPRKFYNGRQFVVEFLVKGCLPDGTVPPAGTASTFYDNLHLLAALCVQDRAPLEHTLPDGTRRVLDVGVLNAVEPERYLAGMQARVKVAFTSADAWWRGLDVTTATFTLAAGATRKLVEFAPSNGRIDDALVTFAGGSTTGNNPLLTQVETGMGLGYNRSFTAAEQITLGDYTWDPVGFTFDRTALVTAKRIGTWWVLDPVPGDAPTLRLDLTGGGPMEITVAARQSWAVG